VIEVIDSGRLLSIQDLGRPGYERFGVPPGGAADWFAARVANRLVGNHPDAAVLEITDSGPTLMFHEEAIVAVTGAGVELNAYDVRPFWRAQRIEAGRMLALGRLAPGLRAYLAVRGGIDVEPVLGSRSLCQRGQFGGGYGRPLRHGDALPIGNMVAGAASTRTWPLGHRLQPLGPWQVRVISGPHSDAFPAGALGRLTAVACLVTPAIDRMGLRIEAPGLRLRAESAILTTPVTAGSIQVTPSGELIVLFVDHPTTGGYPVIGTVITADLPFLAQARPGDTIRFGEVDPVEAARGLRRLEDWCEPN
jgi:antagonist of KipI